MLYEIKFINVKINKDNFSCINVGIISVIFFIHANTTPLLTFAVLELAVKWIPYNNKQIHA